MNRTKRFSHLSFVILFVLAIGGMIAPTGAADLHPITPSHPNSPVASWPSLPSSAVPSVPQVVYDLTFTGNNEVFFYLEVYRNSGQYIYWGEFYRDGVLLKTLSAGYKGYYEDTGLAKGQTFQYNYRILQQDVETGQVSVAYTYTESATTGQVQGTIHRDMTWNGEWQLAYDAVTSLHVLPGVKLTIAPGATVAGPTAEQRPKINVDGVLEATEATLRNLIIQSSYTIELAGFASIRRCTLETVNILSFIHLYAFSFNTGFCSLGRCWITSFPSVSTPMEYVGNTLTEYCLRFQLEQPLDIQLLVANNRIWERSPVYGTTYSSLSIQGDTGANSKIVIRNNLFGGSMEFVPHSAGHFVHGLSITDNRVSALFIQQAINSLIANNHFDCGSYPVPASGVIYLSSGTTGAQVIGNQVTCGPDFYWAIGMQGDDWDLPHGNTVHDNVAPDGHIYLESHGNTVYNNILYSASTPTWGGCGTISCTNIWNVAASPGPNIIGGPSIGGNWWGEEYDGEDTNGDGFGDTPYIIEDDPPNIDNLPLMGSLGPDLLVNPFPLNLGQVTFDPAARRYLLPVDVMVENVGATATAAADARFSDTGGWSTTQPIPTLAPGVSTTLHMEWDLTPVLLAGQGQTTAQLTVVADPNQVLTDTIRGNNTRAGQITVDAHPRLLEIKPEYTLKSSYFLNNTSLPNRLRVLVDWNGDLPDLAAAPYGNLYFDLNGSLAAIQGESWGGEHTYDMGANFRSSFACANNTLRIYATHGVQGGALRSLEEVIQPTVFPFPMWVEWAIQNLPGSDASFDTTLKVPLAEYTYDFKYPDPPFEATWTPPNWIPYLGGQELGIADTQASANALGRTDGSGRARVTGQTALQLAAINPQGDLWGEGEVQFKCGESLDLTRAQLGFNIKLPIEKEASLVDVVPAAKAAVEWPVIGRIIKWVLGVAKVKASLTPEVNIKTEFEEQVGTLHFVNGEGTGKLDAKAALAIEPCEDLNAEVYGGGTPYVTVQVPKNPSYLKEVGIDLYYGASFQAWEFETEYERKVNCNYPGGCAEVEEGDQLSVISAQEGAALAPTWYLIPRNGHNPDNKMGTASSSFTLYSSSFSAETVLLIGIYPRPEPALAVRGDGRRLLAYVHDDVAKPHGRGTEVNIFTYNGSAWSGPAALTNDQQPDFNPALAFDTGGKGLLIWERSTLPASITPTLDITFAQSLEISARAWDGASWGSPVTLTQNSLMDHAPQLAASSDGTALALWQTNDGADTLGTPAHPLTLTSAVWNGSAWLTPTAAIAGLHDVVNVAVAAFSSTQAALVYARDMDSLLTTTADLELWYSALDGAAWGAPARLTTDAITDTTPTLAYDANGVLHLAWLRGGNIAWLRDSWNAADAQTINTGNEAGMLALSLSRADDGNLALAWQAMGTGGSDLAYHVYDAATGGWSAELSLMSNPSIEAAHSTAFGADGKLYLAYQKIATQRVTQTFQISPTLSYTVTNLLVEGASDLAFLEHTVGRDLTFDRLSADPANPAPGQAVTLTAVLRNAGDLGVVNPQVAFYDDTVYPTQTLILSRTLAITLGAGYTTTVQANWSVPPSASPRPRSVRAVADPANQLAETDENNNAIELATTLPDVRVEVFYIEHAADALTLIARLGNAGALTITTPFTVAFRTADPLMGTQIAAATVNARIGIGDQITVTHVLTDLSVLVNAGSLWLPSGSLWLLADAGNAVAEADEDNNADFAALKFLPDLALAAGNISSKGMLTVTVYNTGYLTATGVLIEARLDGLTGTLVSTSTLAALAPGGSQALALSPPAGQYALFVKSDPADTIAEIDESNNLAIVELASTVWNNVYLPLVLK